jgi:hypothetical protein
VAHATQASRRRHARDRFESIGKWRLRGSGKYPVNKNAEGCLAGSRVNTGQSEAHTFSARHSGMRRKAQARNP